MQKQTCSQWSATDSENHSVSTDLFAISFSPNSFFPPTFVEKPFLSLSGHERIKTLLADELTARALGWAAAINQASCPVRLSF